MRSPYLDRPIEIRNPSMQARDVVARPKEVLAGFAIPPEWHERGQCRKENADLFFPDRCADATAAKVACAVCPVLAECRDWALSTGEPFGVWGGMTEKERQRYLLLQKRGAA